MKNSIKDISKDEISQGKILRVSMMVLISLLSFIFLFPKQISENPFLSKIFDLDNITLRIMWFLTLLLIIAYIIMSFIVESLIANKILTFEIERKQEMIFSSFLNHEVARHNGEFLGAVFNTQDLCRYILESEYKSSNYYVDKIKNIFFNLNTISELTAMGLSQIIVEKAENKNLIKKTEDFPSLSESYEILIEFMV